MEAVAKLHANILNMAQNNRGCKFVPATRNKEKFQKIRTGNPTQIDKPGKHT